MISHKIFIPFLILFIMILALSGCRSHLPANFATVEEAFPPAETKTPANIPSDSIKRSIFEVPFEDVFRAVMVSVSQVQMNIESNDKNKGIILATRTIEVPPPFHSDLGDNRRPKQRNYYYKIMVIEKGPKSTEVIAFAKTQGSCTDWSIDAAFGSPCPKYAALHWAQNQDSSARELTQLMTFIRNNLIAAGLI
jgi:hypothetical protein